MNSFRQLLIYEIELQGYEGQTPSVTPRQAPRVLTEVLTEPEQLKSASTSAIFTSSSSCASSGTFSLNSKHFCISRLDPTFLETSYNRRNRLIIRCNPSLSNDKSFSSQIVNRSTKCSLYDACNKSTHCTAVTSTLKLNATSFV